MTVKVMVESDIESDIESDTECITASRHVVSIRHESEGEASY